MADDIDARISLIGLCIHYKAAAPDIISMSSLVMTACLVRLYVIRSFSIISPGTRKEEIKSAIGLFSRYSKPRLSRTHLSRIFAQLGQNFENG